MASTPSPNEQDDEIPKIWDIFTSSKGKVGSHISDNKSNEQESEHLKEEESEYRSGFRNGSEEEDGLSD